MTFCRKVVVFTAVAVVVAAVASCGGVDGFGKLLSKLATRKKVMGAKGVVVGGGRRGAVVVGASCCSSSLSMDSLDCAQSTPADSVVLASAEEQEEGWLQ